MLVLLSYVLLDSSARTHDAGLIVGAAVGPGVGANVVDDTGAAVGEFVVEGSKNATPLLFPA